jgi:hypothetical protein
LNRSRALDAVEEILLYALRVAAEKMPEIKVRASAIKSAVSEFRRCRCSTLSDADLAAMLEAPGQLFKMFALYTETGCLAEAKGRKTLH